MMSRLFLVRHGPTHVKAMVGWTDVKADLTDSAALARLRASLPQKALMISSDLRRAIDTADALQLRQRRLPHATGLREMHFGDWEMKTFNDVNVTDPDGIFAFYDTPGDVAPPNGESWNMFSARVDTALDTLRAEYHGSDLIIVAHFGVILRQFQRAKAISAYQAFGQKIENLSLTEIEITDHLWRVNRVNALI
ncbi:histidine phosphatase family protein [Rhodobacteraceae bacterium IMCC1335]|jgi:broad specificity phosphatase PhoE